MFICLFVDLSACQLTKHPKSLKLIINHSIITQSSTSHTTLQQQTQQHIEHHTMVVKSSMATMASNFIWQKIWSLLFIAPVTFGHRSSHSWSKSAKSGHSWSFGHTYNTLTTVTHNCLVYDWFEKFMPICRH